MDVEDGVDRRKRLLILSNQDDFRRKVEARFPRHRYVVSSSWQEFPAPDLIVSGCDYHCGFEKCLGVFSLSARFPSIPHLVARPVLAKRLMVSPDEFFWAEFSESADGVLPDNAWIDQLDPGHPGFPILSVQREIVEGRGKISKVADVGGPGKFRPNRFSEKFKRASGDSAKRLIDDIRLCHAFRDIVVLKNSIKVTAFRYGYNPFSLSRAFLKKFGVRPSKIIRED